MQLEEFHTGLFQANLLYNIDIDEDEYEEIALIAWNRIGNKITKLYHYDTKLSCNEDYIDLPCNCYYLEAVTACEEDWNRTTNYSNHGDINTSYVEQYIESDKRGTNAFYIPGHYLQYERVGMRLYFKEKHPGNIHILYHGIAADEEGMPLITRKESEAIAAFVAFTVYFKQALSTKDGNLYKFAQDLEVKWHKLCDSARVVEHFSQNDEDKILNARSSWNRKSYGKSYKPMIK